MSSILRAPLEQLSSTRLASAHRGALDDAPPSALARSPTIAPGPFQHPTPIGNSITRTILSTHRPTLGAFCANRTQRKAPIALLTTVVALFTLLLSMITPFVQATTPYVFHFPRDHGAHPTYRTEWWYVTGHLVTPQGRPFGFEVTFFRIGLRPPHTETGAGIGRSHWRADTLYPAHFAVTDPVGQQFLSTERLERGALDIAAASSTDLAVHAASWYLKRSANGTLLLAARSPRASLRLTLRPQKSPAIHGVDGISRKGACASCASHYVSLTHLASDGRLTLDGRAYRVHGLSWFDHEFGSSELDPSEVGWDWFGIMLKDGRDIMIYRLRHADGTIDRASSGSLIAADGSMTHLTRDQVEITTLGHWQSAQTHAIYPSGWHLRIPTARIDITLAPKVAAQELTPRVGPAYWEGASSVTDRAGHERGDAYVELTGYAENVAI